jgi:hypothetical protein
MQPSTYRAASNARIDRAGSIAEQPSILRMKSMLIPLRSNELFGGVATAAASNPTIQPIIINSSIIADFHERQLSKRVAAICAAPTIAASFKQSEIQFSTAASRKSRGGGPPHENR